MRRRRKMRPYGASRFEVFECAYGCCGGPLHAGNISLDIKKCFAKRARHRERRLGKLLCKQAED
jgi:iron only hydrogenase large subunit-like protein